MTKRFYTLILFLLLHAPLYSQNNVYPEDVNFFYFREHRKSFTDSLFRNAEDSAALTKFYSDHYARTEAVTLKQGRLQIHMACDRSLAICINPIRYESLIVELSLKNHQGRLDLPINISELLKETVESENKRLNVTKKTYEQLFAYRIDRKYAKRIIQDVANLTVALEPKLEDIRKQAQDIDNLLADRTKNEVAILTAIKELEKLYPDIKSGRLKFLVSKLLPRDVLIVNLTQYLILHYDENYIKGMDCCPDNSGSDHWRVAKSKVCGIMGIDQGVKLRLIDKDKKDVVAYYNAAFASGWNGSGDTENDSVPKIDPRSFLSVREGSKRYKTNDIVWANFQQKKNIIDSRSEVLLTFDLDKLKAETSFTGNISLMAQINDSDPIEVPPYSVIGEAYSRVGTRSLSPQEYALSFLSEMLDIYDLTNGNRFKQLKNKVNNNALNARLVEWLADPNHHDKLKDALSTSLTPKDGIVTISKLDSARAADLYDAANKRSIGQEILTTSTDSLNKPKNISEVAATLKESVESIALELKGKQNVVISRFIEYDLVDNVDFAVRNLKNHRDYFLRFINSDPNTLFAVLTEIHRDSLFLAHAASTMTELIQKLEPLQQELQAIKTVLLTSNGTVNDALRYKIEDLAVRIEVQLSRFVGFMEAVRVFEQKEFAEARANFLKNHGKRPSEDNHLFIEQWSVDLASRAANQIYKKLITGKIDLTKRNITDGTKLSIYVLWYETPGKPAQKLPVATFILKKLGWNEYLTDTFLLVNRLGETDNAERYKGSAGGAFMWTYTSGENADFFQRLQPSIGINVCYLDFNPDLSFEIGVGVLAGLWKNKVFFGWGRNLHNVDSSAYFSIGFSFANIAEKWNTRQASNQTE